MWACLPLLHSLRNHLAYDYFAKGTFSLLSSWLNNYNVTQHLWSQFIACSTLFLYSTVRWVTLTSFHKLKLIYVILYARDKRTAGNHQGEMRAVHELFLQSAVSLPKAHTRRFLSRVQCYSSSTSVTQKATQLSQLYSGITENRLGPKSPTSTWNIPVLSKVNT